jgi:beta-glucanase (GH16 family)
MNDRLRIAVLGIGLACIMVMAAGYTPDSLPDKKMKLVWSDEFSKEGQPDSALWGYDIGDGCPDNCGWGNNELQFYTGNRSENARVKNGVWPAIWMLPTDWEYGGWPGSGEIDIMEFVGYMPDSLFGTVHTERFNHIKGTQVSKGVYSTTLSSDFHEYGIEWDAEKIEFYFDGEKYLTFHNNHAGPEAWPFDRDFHMVLNIAVGGNWGGKMGVDESIWPQKMLVDYVRVYQ